MKTKTKIDLALSIFAIIILFAISSYLVSFYLPQIKEVIAKYYFIGVIAFITLEALVIVIAPLTSTPLIPVASQTYGIIITFFLVYLGTTIGSLIAFFLARRYGKRIVSKFISLEEAEDLVEGLPRKNRFLSLVILRVIIPADILSYSLGIFTKISYPTFLITLLVGTIPSAIFFSVLGKLPIYYQIISWILALIIIFFLYKLLRIKNLKK